MADSIQPRRASITLSFTEFETDGAEGTSETWVLQKGRAADRESTAGRIMLGLSAEKRKFVRKRVQEFIDVLEKQLDGWKDS